MQAAAYNLNKEGWPTPHISVLVNYHAIPHQPPHRRRCEYHCELGFIYPADGDPPLDGFKMHSVVEKVHFQQSSREESLRLFQDNA